MNEAIAHQLRVTRQEHEAKLRSAVNARRSLGRGEAHRIPQADATIVHYRAKVDEAKAAEAAAGVDRARYG